MKKICYLLIFIVNLSFGQTVKLTVPEIEKYANSIDKLVAENQLVKVSYPNMSGCGGGVCGYYLNKELVLIDATYNAELGFSSRAIYMDGDQFLKISYREYFAEWGKYDAQYPADKFEFDPTKMTYTDTVYSIILTDTVIFKKKAGNKLISGKYDQLLSDRLISCGQEMKLELQEVTAQMDSLKFVSEMPYICVTGICGDDLYWEAVSVGKYNIELLIDQLDDTTSTAANVVLFGYNYTVADIAYTALSEIIHDIPTFDLLGVPFDQAGCGYCSYYQHLNEDISNRQRFKDAVRNWYHQNKGNLIWVESQTFSTCECSGQHPNGGHYELKTDKE